MTNFYKCSFVFDEEGEIESDILTALLGEAGFDSFDNNENVLNAYIPEQLYKEENVLKTIASYPFNHIISWNSNIVKGQDWNEEWEKESFHPINIKNECVIHSSSHEDYISAKYDILINPKMSFGTGTHETTTLMIENLLESDISDKNVLDVGTGTGILAILCSMMGASEVNGVELDPVAADNAEDNIKINNLSNVKVIRGDISSVENSNEYYDIILANINRNILIHDMPYYASNLKSGGKLQLSGFYSEDVKLLVSEANRFNLELIKQDKKNEWNILVFVKK